MRRQLALVTLLVCETEVLPVVGHVRQADQQAPGRGCGLIEPGAGAMSCWSAARRVLGVMPDGPQSWKIRLAMTRP